MIKVRDIRHFYTCVRPTSDGWSEAIPILTPSLPMARARPGAGPRGRRAECWHRRKAPHRPLQFGGGELLQGAMRFSVEGCVVNRLSMPCPDSGLMMNMCAVAGLRSASMFGIWCARVVDLGERRGEPHRLAEDARAQIVGGVFARAADRHLHQHGAERREDHHRDAIR